MNDKLDKVLRNWAERTVGDKKDLAGLERRIAMKMREALHDSATALPEAPFFTLWGRLAWFSLGAVTACAVALAVVRLPPPANDVGTPDIVQSSESFHRMFAEVNRLFSGNLRWVAQSGGEVELGIDPSQEESEQDRDPFAVHLAVVSRSGGHGPWSKVWESDILTRSEQAIDIAPDRKSKDRVALWIHPVAEGRFAVDSRLSLNTAVRINSNSSDILDNGKPQAIAVMLIGDTEYRVYQTVTEIRKTKEGGSC